MPPVGDSQSVASWLRQYNPGAPLRSLDDALAANGPLRDTLLSLKAALDSDQRASEALREDLAQSQQKIRTLRNSLSHFSAHAESLSDRLFRAEASSVAAQQCLTSQLAKVGEERDAVRALNLVWEARWREERTRREEAEESVRVGRHAASNDRQAKSADDQDAHTRTVVVNAWRRLDKTRSRPSTAGTQGGRSRATTSSPSPIPTGTSVVADLAEEARLLRAEMKDLVDSRDNEVIRLENEIRLRRSEMTQLYSSLDKLLSLSFAAPPPDTTTPSNSSALDAARIVLDPPAIRSAESQPRLVSDETGGEDTRELEQEIRIMERKIRMLSGGAPAPSESSMDPVGGSGLQVPVDDPTASLLQRVQLLEAQLATTQDQLKETRRQKAKLDYEKSFTSSRTVHEPERDDAQKAYIERLEADRSRLSNLLESSEAEALSVSRELAATHAHVDALSERVRIKLEEQRAKLHAAYREIRRLLRALDQR